MLRFAVSRFNDAGLFFGHGSDNAHDEAAYLILHTLNLPLDTLEPYLDAKLLQSEKEEVLSIIERRAVEHIPAAYLTHQAWQGEFDFYVDERVIVPRSFIYELLGDGIRPWIEHDELVHRALDLCTGSGCLAIQMAHHDGLDATRQIILQAAKYLNPKGVLLVEIGHNREVLEAVYPELPFTWLETSGGDGFVFLLTREQLLGEE